jgi:hypothetical protein
MDGSRTRRTCRPSARAQLRTRHEKGWMMTLENAVDELTPRHIGAAVGTGAKRAATTLAAAALAALVLMTWTSQARAEPTPTVSVSFSCSGVTFKFEGFPNAPNNKVTEIVRADKVIIFRGTFTFNGPSAENTVAITLAPGHHSIVAAAKWNTNGVKGEKDIPLKNGITCPPHVFLGYADSIHEDGFHPSPWEGSPGVTFIGCGFGGTDSCPMSGGFDVYDAGAIRIEAPASESLKVTGASVQIGPCSYSPWPGLNVTIAAGETLILTQTGKAKCTETNTAEQDNFDTSQSFLKSTQYQEFKETGKCSNDGFIPMITLTINGKTTTLQDVGQVLNGGGIDPDLCQSINEGQEWVQIQ